MRKSGAMKRYAHCPDCGAEMRPSALLCRACFKRAGGAWAPIYRAAAARGEARQTTPATGSVNVSSNPAGADVFADGDFVGNSPAVLKLEPGKHTVAVKTSGYTDWSKEITVQSGSEVQLTANLEKHSP
jgi:hypothetical protein